MIVKSRYYIVTIILFVILLLTDGILIKQNSELKNNAFLHQTLDVSLDFAQEEIKAIKTERFLEGKSLHEIFDAKTPYTLLFVFSTKGCHSCIDDATYNLNQFLLTSDAQKCSVRSVLVDKDENLRSVKNALKMRFQLDYPKSSFLEQKIILDNLPFVFLLDNKRHKVIYAFNTNPLRKLDEKFLPQVSRFLSAKL